jgi:hypothetical protein
MSAFLTPLFNDKKQFKPSTRKQPNSDSSGYENKFTSVFRDMLHYNNRINGLTKYLIIIITVIISAGLLAGIYELLA